MEWLNYHHLLYFRAVVREGTVARAAASLCRSQPTLSAQLRALEQSLGEKLFSRDGRRLVLTDLGRRVLVYAEEIFSLGKEIREVVRGRSGGLHLRLHVGVADVLPKLVTRQLLKPVLLLPGPVRLVCVEGKPERLLGDLALHDLDLVLSDAPANADVKVKAFSHLLGECGVTFFAAGRHRSLRRGFPGSLDGAPFIVPTRNTTLRRGLEEWFERRDLRPDIVGEFEDSALLKVFGQAGLGVFAAPTVVEEDILRQYGVRVLGRTKEVRERFYAISVERRLKHPAVVAICREARKHLQCS